MLPNNDALTHSKLLLMHLKTLSAELNQEERQQQEQSVKEAKQRRIKDEDRWREQQKVRVSTSCRFRASV